MRKIIIIWPKGDHYDYVACNLLKCVCVFLSVITIGIRWGAGKSFDTFSDSLIIRSVLAMLSTLNRVVQSISGREHIFKVMFVCDCHHH